jgi:hypothetical protein
MRVVARVSGLLDRRSEVGQSALVSTEPYVVHDGILAARACVVILGAHRAGERSRRLTYTSLGPGQERHADVTCDMTII